MPSLPPLLTSAVLATVVLTAVFITNPAPHLPRTARPRGASSASGCISPVVYNKPPKTASTAIVAQMRKWAAEANRTVYSCSPRTRLSLKQFTADCLPTTPDVCGLTAFHVILSPPFIAKLRTAFPSYRLLTSTRPARERIISYHLQMAAVRLDEHHPFDPTRLKEFLENRYNRWHLFNYHAGTEFPDSTPLSDPMRAAIEELTAGFDIVIDASLQTASNTVLRHHGLFQLNGRTANVRTNASFVVPPEIEALLTKASDVENTIHRSLVRRLATQYAQAGGDASCARMERDEDVHDCLAAADS